MFGRYYVQRGNSTQEKVKTVAEKADQESLIQIEFLVCDRRTIDRRRERFKSWVQDNCGIRLGSFDRGRGDACAAPAHGHNSVQPLPSKPSRGRVIPAALAVPCPYVSDQGKEQAGNSGIPAFAPGFSGQRMSRKVETATPAPRMGHEHAGSAGAGSINVATVSLGPSRGRWRRSSGSGSRRCGRSTSPCGRARSG